MAKILWIAARDGTITHLNQGWFEVTGLNVHESLGLSIFNAIHPDEKDPAMNLWLQAVNEGENYEIEVKLLQADGSYVPFVFCAQPTYSEREELNQWVGTGIKSQYSDELSKQPKAVQRDKLHPEVKTQDSGVGELGVNLCSPNPNLKNQQTNQIQESEFLQSLLANLSDGILACNAQGRLVFLNQAAQTLLGLEQESISTEQWANHYDLYYPDSTTRMQTEDVPLVRALHGESVFGVEMKIAPKHGQARTVLTNGEPVFNLAGKKLGAVVAMRDITEYKQAVTALVEREQFLQSIYEGVEEAIFIVDVLEGDFKYSYFNPAAERLTGVSLAEILGKTPEQSFPPPVAAAVRQNYSRCVTVGEKITYEECLPFKGKDTWWLTTLNPLRDDRSRIYCLVGTTLNFTERKLIETEIIKLNQNLEQRIAQRTSELETAIADVQNYAQRLDLAIDAAKMGSWDWDLSTNQVFWTTYHEQILGYQPGKPERTYQEWADRVHLDDLPGVKAKIQKSLADHEEYVCQYRVVWPDGNVRWVDTLGRGHYDAEGNPIRMVGVIRDITERKQAEAELAESEARFRSTFEQAAVGIAHVGLDGRWLRVNQKLCDIVGYTHEELLSSTFQAITHPEDLATDLAYVEQLLAGEIANYSMEKRYIHQDGSLVWVNLTVSLAKSETSPEPIDPKYFISVIEEIGDRKQAEIELQQRAQKLEWLNRLLTQTSALLKKRNEELDQFAYVASHDLKAPLRAIANLSEWIEEDLEGQLPAENQRQMELLRGRVHRLEALINGLLEYSRVSRTERAEETVDVGVLLEEIIDSLDPPSTFTIEIQPGMPSIKTKRILLSQVFSNLISNAIKHHHRRDGHIKISYQKQGGFYEFSVADDGLGIAPEHHDKVFAIFQTLQPRDRTESTGIGLAIVKKIIETEGGSINLESKPAEALGAIFRFTWRQEMTKN